MPAADQAELALIRATLAANGIEYVVVNEFGGFGFPGAFALDARSVQVRSKDMAAAKEALADWSP